MTIYRGWRTNGRGRVDVDSFGQALPRMLDKQRNLRHYATEFEWGEASQGAAQLALAILADHFYRKMTDRVKAAERAIRLHEKFKMAFVVKFEKEEWILNDIEISKWLREVLNAPKMVQHPPREGRLTSVKPNLLSDQAFNFEGVRYSSLMDFLMHGQEGGYLEAMVPGEEDKLREAIHAYTEQMKNDQADAGAIEEETELAQAARLLHEVWTQPYEETREGRIEAFLGQPYVAAILRRQRCSEKLSVELDDPIEGTPEKFVQCLRYEEHVGIRHLFPVDWTVEKQGTDTTWTIKLYPFAADHAPDSMGPRLELWVKQGPSRVAMADRSWGVVLTNGPSEETGFSYGEFSTDEIDTLKDYAIEWTRKFLARLTEELSAVNPL